MVGEELLSDDESDEEENEKQLKKAAKLSSCRPDFSRSRSEREGGEGEETNNDDSAQI